MRRTQSELAVMRRFRTLDAIALACSEALGVPLDDLIGPSRKSEICRARFIAMKRCYLAGYSLPEIGRYFNRHHTTVLHGIRKLRQLELEAAE